MPRFHPSSGRLAVLFLFVPVMLLTAGRAVGAESVSEPMQPRAHASFLAMSVVHLPGRQRAQLSSALQLDDRQAPVSQYGATFGWMEGSGEVLLISQGASQSNSLLARTQRVLEGGVPIRAFAELPRYLMLCSWGEVGEAQEEVPPVMAYAERDDANGRRRSTRAYDSLSVPWVPTAARRAQQVFAAHDWCAEIAHSGQSSAPLWQADGRQAAP